MTISDNNSFKFRDTYTLHFKSHYFCRQITSMGKTIRYNGRALLALLLTAVLVSSLLIKPAHILFVHHDRSEATHTGHSLSNVSTYQDHDCSICDFEFCSFIPQKQVIVPQVTMFSLNELASRTVACFVCNSSHNFQLRAPPAC